MVQQFSPDSTQTKIKYPDSDGQPMADNTLQFQWIVTIKENLELLFANDENVFVAGDLLWYPLEGDNKTRRAPDAMVAFGRPKGYRGSYQQWLEDNIAPQVVFEILSPGNRLTEMELKRRFYEHHGVEEYYLYNPNENDLVGWQRRDGALEVIQPIQNWQSPRLGIRFELEEETMKIFTPGGKPFVSFQELDQQRKLAEENLQTEQLMRQDAEDKLAKLQAKMRSLGLDPDEI
ncbi:MAG: Uma2 family endonuclease [Limnothrix sp. RL_2_0]|nr:Uma2 family endonuclease [Limnothrix sp. RL_2_0]